MKTLTIRMPDKIQCLIIAHMSFNENGSINVGQSAIGNAEIEQGVYDILTDVNVHDNGGNND